MAGVASGLALATTLMAMQVADTMSARTCTYRAAEVTAVEARTDHGFLGIRYVFSRDSGALVDSVLQGTPAEAIGILPGDHVLSVNGDPIDTPNELQEVIFGARPGTRPTIVIERDGNTRTLHPTLVSWPSVTY